VQLTTEPLGARTHRTALYVKSKRSIIIWDMGIS